MPRKKKNIDIGKIDLSGLGKIKIIRELKPSIKILKEEKSSKKEKQEDSENEEEQEEAEQQFVSSKNFTRDLSFSRATVLESHQIATENLENEIAKTPIQQTTEEKTQKPSYVQNMPQYGTPSYNSKTSGDEMDEREFKRTDMEMNIARTNFDTRPAGFTLQEGGVRQINIGNLQRQEMQRGMGSSSSIDNEREYVITAKRNKKDKEKLPFE